MTLRIKFFLTTGIAIVALAGVSEWITYRQTAAFLDTHEALMRHGPEGAALVALPAQKHLLLVKLTGVRLLNAAIAMLALIAVLNCLWGRFIASPMRALLRHINWMSRGTWKDPIVTRQQDEMGDLTRAFNALGETLTFTVEQVAAASKLSALALISQRIVRNTEDAKARIVQVKGALTPALKPGSIVLSEVGATLDEAVEILNRIPSQVEAEFYGHFREAGRAWKQTRSGAPSPGAKPQASLKA